MKKEYGFIFDIKKCVQCHACELACKVINNIEAGISWRKISTLWEDEFPEVKSVTISIACIHCIDPECIKVCPAEAILKNEKNGIVFVDSDKCIACGSCGEACPVQAPQYGKDDKMQKCDLCVDRVTAGNAPACVATCPSGALDFAYMDIDDKKDYENKIAKIHQQISDMQKY